MLPCAAFACQRLATVQAAAARLRRARDIVVAAENGGDLSVLCHMIAYTDGVNKRDGL
jgi:hypothetical protein